MINLDKVWGDTRVLGKAAEDWSGLAVAYGDINGDGFMDIIVGAPKADPGERNAAGETYVILGSSPSSPVTIDLSTTPADITVCGAAAWDYSGWAVARGDVNNDGFDDIIVGAPKADPGERNAAGETYLISGGGAFITAHGLGGTIRINSFSLLGRSWGRFKAFGALNSGGDVNLKVGDLDGDGHHEIAAGMGEGGSSWVKVFNL